MTCPDSFTTSRLIAQRLQLGDAAEIHRMHQDAEQMTLLGGVRDEVETAAYMERNLTHWAQYGFGLWLLHDITSNDVVGRALLRTLTLDGADEIEVGYSLYPAYWGRGLAAEAASACLAHASQSLGATSVVALTRPDNVGSQRVLHKIRMHFERTLDHGGVPHVLFRTNRQTAR